MVRSHPHMDPHHPGGGRFHIVRKKIEAVMHGEDGNGPTVLRTVLFLFSVLYGGAGTLRAHLYRQGIKRSRRLPCTVLSIGNLTVGGTGKTPMTVYMARLLKKSGYAVAVVSRGYKGAGETSGGVVSDGFRLYMNVDQAGDEPYLMAMKLAGIPVLIGRDRFAVGMLAMEKFNPDILLLDDGLQHIKLFRDLNIVLLDAAKPFGNGYLLPRGVLREPVHEMARGDAYILTRCDGPPMSPEDQVRFNAMAKRKPVFRCRHMPDFPTAGGISPETRSLDLSLVDPRRLAGRRVFAFSGIARNEHFRKGIIDLGGDVVKFLAYPDHHPYSDRDVAMITAQWKQSRAEVFLTTEKDFVRIGHQFSRSVSLRALGIDISFGDDGEKFKRFLGERLPPVVRVKVKGI